MKVYISGKIGEEVISDATRRKFARAEEMLRAKGYKVFNPASESYQAAIEVSYKIAKATVHIDETMGRYAYILQKDIWALEECDAVYFLDDWDKSPGANVEHSYAMAVGKKLLWQRLEDAQVFHGDNETADDVWLPTEEEEDTV